MIRDSSRNTVALATAIFDLPSGDAELVTRFVRLLLKADPEKQQVALRLLDESSTPSAVTIREVLAAVCAYLDETAVPQ